jgi:hypothetical protein
MSRFNVLEMLRPVREKKVQSLDDYARRIVAGETIPGEVIETALKDADVPHTALQEIIDRLIRQRDLAAIVRAGKAAKPDHDKVESQVDAAEKAFDEARANYRAFLEKVEPERVRLKRIVREGGEAEDELLNERNLSPTQLERLRQAEREVSEADVAAHHAEHKEDRQLVTSINEARQWVEDIKCNAQRPIWVDSKLLDKDEAERLLAVRQAALAQHRASFPKLKAAHEEAKARRLATRAALIKEILAEAKS